jgi:hypothetical protein
VCGEPHWDPEGRWLERSYPAAEPAEEFSKAKHADDGKGMVVEAA